MRMSSGSVDGFIADEVGRPGLAPGRYFRMLLLGYFEGARLRAGDRVAGGRFVERAELSGARAARGAAGSFDGLAHAPSDRHRNEAVFTWVLQRLAAANLVKRKTIGIDATTLEANAA